MQRFNHTAIGVCQGKLQLFSAFEDNGPMWAGKGPRVERRQVRFPQSFLTPPVVHVSVSMWDIEGSSNQRADIASDHVTRDGFEVVFRTWDDTRVARIRADWMAIGAVQHEDDFTL